MRILAVETSGRHGSIALLEGLDHGAELIGQTLLAGSQRTAQALAPGLKDLLVAAGWPAATIGLVAVASGPGSFTGLRIGVTTAKTFAYAVGAQMIGVNTLAVLAAQAPPDVAPLWAVMDAQRQELFAAKFVGAGANPPEMLQETRIVSLADWLAGLALGDRVTGAALRRVAARLPAAVATAPETCWEPSATVVGQLGWFAYCQGRRDDLWSLTPQYFRASAAEEKLATGISRPPPDD